MRATRLIGILGWCLVLSHCAVEGPVGNPEPAPDPADLEVAVTEPVRSKTPRYVPIARIEGYGNPRTGELWARAIPTEGHAVLENGVGVSQQGLTQSPGYCAVDVMADGTPNNNPNGSFEFYTQYDATGLPADQSSFNAATCYGRLAPEFQTAQHSSLFGGSTGVGCALQHVGNFSGTNYDRVLLDIDVFNGDQTKHGPYGPPFTDGTVVTPEGRNAPYQDLGLWDFGPMPSAPQGTTSGPHLKEMWIYFKNGDPTDFNWTGFLLGEVFEACGDAMDDDCDGVADNGCGTFADGISCYSDFDCASGYCDGAVVTSGIGAGGSDLATDVAGSCAPIPTRIDAGWSSTCRLVGGSVDCWGDDGYFLASSAPSGSNYTHLSVGANHACVIATDGSVSCWGSFSSGKANAPAGNDFLDVSAGTEHTCAVHVDGTLECWGSDVNAQLTGMPTGTDFVSVRSGSYHSCALRNNGSILCWGDDTYGQVSGVPAGTVFTQLSVGSYHACALAADQSITCWGDNAFTQVSAAPTDKLNVAVAAGGTHSCAVKADTTVVCWGDASDMRTTTPGGVGYEALALGFTHSCAVKDDDSVVCWGKNDFGQTDVPVTVPVPTPTLRTMTGTFSTTCAIMEDTGKVKCWGNGTASQQHGLSTGIVSLATAAPDLNLGSSRAVSLASGDAHSCAVFEDGSLRCWGDNATHQSRGVAGASVVADPGGSVPAAIDVGGPAVKVVAGWGHTCALREDGEVICFGRNDMGQAGVGNTTTPLPLASSSPVSLGGPVADLCGGLQHNCALLQNGDVRCWGNDYQGSLGQGTTGMDIGDNEAVNSAAAVQVLTSGEIFAGRYVAQIDCGAWATCAVLDDGNMRCWGEGGYGALGYGNGDDIGDDELPNTVGYVNVGSGEFVAEVSTGDDVTCVILQSGGTKCWGDTSRAGGGCLGHGPSCSSVVNAPPSTVIDFGVGRTAVQLNERSRGPSPCARLDDDGVKCWSTNGNYQVGLGHNTTPVDPPSATYTLQPGSLMADKVLGQPSFATGTSGSGTSGLSGPGQVAIDPTDGSIWVADRGNNRVLRYASYAAISSGEAANLVLGQPDFATVVGGTTQSTMNAPEGVFVDGSDHLWVAEVGNDRILRFDNASSITVNGTAASGVLGRPDFVTTANAQVGVNRMYDPFGLAVDAAGNLFVADYGNSRILKFTDAANKANGADADGVLGQTDLVSNTCRNAGLVSQTGMCLPIGITLDGSGTLYVGDHQNSRILAYADAATLADADGGPATHVYGQPDFTTNTASTTQATMAGGSCAAVSPSGDLYAVDRDNDRVLVFSEVDLTSDGPAAMSLFGQMDYVSNNPGGGANRFNAPYYGVFDPGGRFYVSDRSNNRIMIFE